MANKNWPEISQERLCELREMSNTDYWKTPEWAQIRKCILSRDGHACKICNSPAHLQVHHRTYKNPHGREEPIDLVTICERCHMLFHESLKLRNNQSKKHLRRIQGQRVKIKKQFGWSRSMRLRKERLEKKFEETMEQCTI